MAYRTPEEVEKGIAEEFRRELEACDKLTSAYRSRCEPWTGREVLTPPDRILFLEVGRQTKAYRASVDLSRRGYGEQAAMLNRALFESMLVVRWIIANPEAAEERFDRAYRFEQHLKVERENNSGWLEEGEERVSDLPDEELAGLVDDFGQYNERMWTTGQTNIRDFAMTVKDQFDEHEWKLTDNYIRFVHQENNQLLHSTAAGLSKSFTAVPEGFGVWTGPSEVMTYIVLFTAAFVYGQTLQLTADHFELSEPGDVSELTLEISKVFKRLPDGEEKPGRNDPCFCGSGKKFKRCHGA